MIGLTFDPYTLVMLLIGVLIGALLPIGLAVIDEYTERRKRRRLARAVLRRTIPVHSER